jgi:hypothetical protein
MNKTRSALLTLLICLAAAALGAPLAAADGLPVTGVDVGRDGVAGGGFRYVTLRSGKDTLIAQVATRGGKIERTLRIAGDFTIPAVAYDGTAGGLAGDNRALILIKPRAAFPRRSTEFVALHVGPQAMRVTRRIGLRGDFSFDAISPDGRLMYLVDYLDPRDPTRYEVRAYDIRSGRLLAQPIVDPSEPEERMGGIPLARQESADGRWSYTLYQGRSAPFVHALDTVGRTAVCLELPRLTGNLSLVMSDGGQLDVTSQKRPGATARPLLHIDTGTWKVTNASKGGAAGGSGHGPALWLLLGGLLALIAMAGGVAIARRDRGGPIGLGEGDLA